MGSRSIGGLLLRPATVPRLSLQPVSHRARLRSPSWMTHRTLAASSPAHAAQPQPKEEPHEPASAATPEQASQAIDDLFGNMNNPSFRRLASSSAGPSTARSDSSAELQAAQAQHMFGARVFSNGRRTRPGIPQGLNSNRLAIHPANDGLPPAPAPSRLPPAAVPEEEKNYPRLTPAYGRSVELAPDRGRDIVRGIGLLGSLVARNRIRSDAFQQRFHERPGLKRKRLKSERWRARFKKGFTHVTARVSELTRKGW